MFAKLKKKIQDEVGNLSDSSFTSPLGPGSTGTSPGMDDDTPPSSRHRRDNPRSYDRSSTVSSMSNDMASTSKEEIAAMLLRRTEQCKKLELKISEYAQMLREKSRGIEKLETSLEKQQDNQIKRNQELNEQYQASRAAMTDDFAIKLKQKEQEWKQRMDSIEQEKDVLQERLQKAEESKSTQIEEHEKLGFAAQELRQVNHTLLDVQKELSSCKDELYKKEKQLDLSSKHIKDLENQLTSKLDTITKERDKNKESSDAQIDMLKTITAEKITMETRLTTLARELSTTSKLLEEKDDHIDHLQGRISTLETRIHDQDLSGDDRVTALQAERDSFEKKVTESWHQLTQVKLTWSDKITHLEGQNEKLHLKLEESEKKATECIESSIDKDRHYEKQKIELESDIHKQKLDANDKEIQLRAKITSLESQLLSLETAREHDKNLTEQKILQLESRQEEHLDKSLNDDKKLTILEEECNKLKDKISEKELDYKRVQEQLITSQDSVTALRTKISNVEEKLFSSQERLTSLQESFMSHQTDLRTCLQDKDELLVRNAELSQRLRSSEQQYDEADKELIQGADTLSSLQSNHDDLLSKVTNYERQVKDLSEHLCNAETDSSLLQVLQESKKELEEQLTERNKTIRVQQQRITDLKKTLQRELKVQSLPNDDPLDIKDITATPPMQRKHHHEQLHVASFNESPLPSLSPAIIQMNTTCAYPNSSSVMSGEPFSMNSKRLISFKSERNGGARLEDSVNFEYLRHVVLKFMLSRETEALHLIKAVSMLLKFTRDEQTLIKETLEWKTSWFGIKPSVGQGQKAKIIPPSY